MQLGFPHPPARLPTPGPRSLSASPHIQQYLPPTATIAVGVCPSHRPPSTPATCRVWLPLTPVQPSRTPAHASLFPSTPPVLPPPPPVWLTPHAHPRFTPPPRAEVTGGKAQDRSSRFKPRPAFHLPQEPTQCHGFPRQPARTFHTACPTRNGSGCLETSSPPPGLPRARRRPMFQSCFPLSQPVAGLHPRAMQSGFPHPARPCPPRATQFWFPLASAHAVWACPSPRPPCRPARSGSLASPHPVHRTRLHPRPLCSLATLPLAPPALIRPCRPRSLVSPHPPPSTSPMQVWLSPRLMGSARLPPPPHSLVFPRTSRKYLDLPHGPLQSGFPSTPSLPGGLLHPCHGIWAIPWDPPRPLPRAALHAVWLPLTPPAFHTPRPWQSGFPSPAAFHPDHAALDSPHPARLPPLRHSSLASPSDPTGRARRASLPPTRIDDGLAAPRPHRREHLAGRSERPS
ncbi:hypothetical protein C7M84_010232 [Penaeus vannamei]|uniref:Uncharacterized protein n=1 Tax=Penaeus vannamei TaxID=6689 RepID=A0A423T4J8_PENVA|nr:hypothetical protein C7M84_010232 [Penaeus vannamei]